MANEDAIQTIDLANAGELLKDQIKHAFVQLIPEAQWEAMVQGEIEKFMKPTIERSGYNNQDRTEVPPAFETLAQDILSKHMTEQLEVRIRDVDWMPNGETFMLMVSKWLEANKEEMFDMLLQKMMTGFVTSMVNNAASAASLTVSQMISDNQAPGIRDPNNPVYDTMGNYIG